MKKSLTLTLLLAGFLAASQIDELGELSLENLLDIPVEASTSFEESILSAPASVSVLEEKDWIKHGAKRPIDALNNLTGVQAYTDNVASGATLQIRGYSEILPRGVAFLLDDVPLNGYVFGTADLSFHQIGLNGIKSIELVRGPGSVNYGTDAFHGAVAVHTQEGYKDASRVMADIGTNNYASASLSSTVVSENYIVDFAFQGTSQGDQRRKFDYVDLGTGNTIEGNRKMKTKYYNTMLKVRSNLDSDFAYELGLYSMGADNEDFAGMGRLTGGNANLGVFDHLDQDNRLDVLQGKVVYTGIDGFKIKISSFLWENDRTVERYFSNGTNILLQEQQLVQQRKGVNIKVNSTQAYLNTLVSLSAGYDQIDIKRGHSNIYSQTGALLTGFFEPYDGDTRRVRDIALEFKTTYGELEFNYGARLDHYESFGDQLSPRFGMSYKYDAGSVVKVLYSQAFRAGTAAEQTSTTQTMGDPNIKPETLDSYEIIWLQAKDNTKLEVSLFQTHWKNAIVRTSGANARYVNRDENHAYGLEFNGAYIYSESLEFDVGFAYVKSKSNENDEDYVGYPEQTLDFGVQYTMNAKSKVYFTNKIMRKVSATTQTTSVELPTYWQSDIHADYEASKDLKYDLHIYNMFNRDNYTSSLQLDPNGMRTQSLSAMLSATYTF